MVRNEKNLRRKFESDVISIINILIFSN